MGIISGAFGGYIASLLSEADNEKEKDEIKTNALQKHYAGSYLRQNGFYNSIDQSNFGQVSLDPGKYFELKIVPKNGYIVYVVSLKFSKDDLLDPDDYIFWVDGKKVKSSFYEYGPTIPREVTDYVLMRVENESSSNITLEYLAYLRGDREEEVEKVYDALEGV